MGTEIFFGKSEKRLDTPVKKPPDGQITCDREMFALSPLRSAGLSASLRSALPRCNQDVFNAPPRLNMIALPWLLSTHNGNASVLCRGVRSTGREPRPPLPIGTAAFDLALWPSRRRNLEIHDRHALAPRAQRFYVGRRRMIAIMVAGRALLNVASVFCLDRPNYLLELIVID